MIHEINKEQQSKALIIDDEASICDSLAGVLHDEEWLTVKALSGKEGIRKFVKEMPDIVLLDVWMPEMDGIETLQKIKELNPQIPVIIMSGHGTIETAVKVTKLGAFDFLEKPLSMDKLLPMLDHANEMKNIKSHTSSSADRQYQLIGESEAIKEVRRLIDIVAPRNSWVLITGENGTGKENVARNIHMRSSRANRSFIALNCAAIPEELIESELFGHSKGAFTNAIANKRGKFELAHQGTLFLDEIGDMSAKTQAKILRILQEQQFERLGDNHSINVDVRVIAATNKNLETQIKNGQFREDLYYRLNVIPFHLPLLRQRGNDVIVLAEYFLKLVAFELGEPVKKLTPEVHEILLNYHWPGNVRELRNVVERLCIMVCGDKIKVEDLPATLVGKEFVSRDFNEYAKSSSAATLKQAKTNFERSFILDKLQDHDWNISKTAEAIGIERSHLHRKLKAYDIDLKRIKG